MGSYNSNGQQYALITDLTSVISAAALNHPSTGTTAQNAALLRASEFVDTYLRQQFVLPLNTWGSDVVQATCDIAAYRLVCLRGFNPEKDGLYKDNFDSSVKWLSDVAKGLVSPDVKDSSPDTDVGKQAGVASPAVYSPSIITTSGNQTRGVGNR